MSNGIFINRAAPGIAHLQPYVPGKPVSELERELGVRDSVKLASNENPLGPSPKVLEAVRDGLSELIRYPDGAAYALRSALAQRHDVAPDCITIGNGSNDVLDMIARVFLYRGRESLFSEHAFAVYPLSSMAVGAELRIARARDFGHDLDVMASLIGQATGVIWIANPNNPTGTWLREDELHAFIASVPREVIVVVDEAYHEYVRPLHDAYPDSSRWLEEFPNLIVTRTFSKVYGLAALRIGYGLSHPDVADLLNRVRQPFNVNSLAQVAALAALEDHDYVQRSVGLNGQGLEQLTRGLERLGLGYIPSVGNFVSVDVGRPAAEVDLALLQLGVITRPVENYGLKGYLRVSVGLPEENERFLRALEQVL
jgi:histidinol-phosphate aminotransferase